MALEIVAAPPRLKPKKSQSQRVEIIATTTKIWQRNISNHIVKME